MGTKIQTPFQSKMRHRSKVCEKGGIFFKNRGEIGHCAVSSAKWLRDLSKLINDERETDDNTSQTPFLTCFCYIEHTHTCWGFFTCELAISMHFSDAEAQSTKSIQKGLIWIVNEPICTMYIAYKYIRCDNSKIF